MSGKFFLFLFAFHLPLTAEQIAVHAVKQGDQAAQPITTEFRAHPSHGLVGQELICEYMVTYDPRRITVRGLEIPQYGSAVFHEPFQGPRRDQVDVQGTQMVRLTWSTKLYPRQKGTVRLPGIQVEYGKIRERQDAFGSIFSWAFSRDEQLHRLQSDDLVLTIDPLPDSAHHIDAVGVYRSCAVQVDRTAVAQGEAVALTVELVGTGNAGFEQTFSPAAPQGVVWYRDGAKRTGAGAQFKFVVQCNGAGTVTIPAQRCVCYDPLKKEFYTLMSQPISISVSPSAATTPAVSTQSSIESDESDGDGECGVDDRETSTGPSLVRKMEIPQTLFWLLCLMLLSGMACWRWRKFLGRACARLMFFCRRLCARLRLTWLTWRGRLTARDAYRFFLSYTAYDRDDREWRDFWLELQRHYFGGHADMILSRGESERVLFWAKRVAGRFFVVILLTIASLQLRADAVPNPVSPGERIRDLRALQRSASLSLYDDIEHQIGELRDPKSTCQRYTSAIARACRVGHLFPFIVWQLLFLCGLLAVFGRRSRIMGMLVILIVGVILLFAEYERSGRWRYVSANTALYLGPGSGYPVRKGLVPGDEVRVIRRVPEKTNRWMFVDACGEKGWLPHDVVV